MLRSLALLVGLTLVTTACALIPPSHPDLAYYPAPRDPTTVKISQTLYRAARAAGDDPDCYSFALIQTTVVTSFAADDATFYFSDGLARLPQRYVDALVAQKVAHEILGHTRKRRTLSMAITAGFAVLGLFMPGFGLADFVVNPLIVRASSREQELAAAQRTIALLRALRRRHAVRRFVRRGQYLDGRRGRARGDAGGSGRAARRALLRHGHSGLSRQDQRERHPCGARARCAGTRLRHAGLGALGRRRPVGGDRRRPADARRARRYSHRPARRRRRARGGRRRSGVSPRRFAHGAGRATGPGLGLRRVPRALAPAR